MAPLNSNIQWYQTAFGNGVYVAVGAQSSGSQPSNSAWSSDGINWTEVTPAQGGLPIGSWTSVAFGNGIFIAVQGTTNFSGAGSAHSSDGKTWTTNSSITASLDIGFTSIAYSSTINKFCTIQYDGFSSDAGLSYTTTDGITWVQQTFGKTSQYNYTSVVAGSDRWVATGTTNGSGYSSLYLLFSGGSWVTGTSNLPYGFGSYWFRQVIFVTDTFYTIGYSNYCYTSTDGATWTQHTMSGVGIGEAPGTIVYGPGKTWNIAGQNYIKYSTNGPFGPYTIVEGDDTTTTNWLNLSYGNGKYIATGFNGTKGNGYSSDGIFWGIANKSITYGINWFFSP